MSGPGCPPSAVIDAWPAEALLRPVRGDPFAFRLVLLDAEGDPVDVALWEWAGELLAGPGVAVPFEFAPDDSGVNVWLRGDATAGLSSLRPYRYDIQARQPAAGEGSTVLAGYVELRSRVTPPLRHDPDLAPGRDEDLVPR